MQFGLKDKEISILIDAFKKMPEIEAVFIYGSRAKDNFKKASDIDLSVRFQRNADKNSDLKLKSILADLPLIYRIDVIDERKINLGNFKNEYEKTKVIFYGDL